MRKTFSKPRSFIAVREPWPDHYRDEAMADLFNPKTRDGIAGYRIFGGKASEYERWLDAEIREFGAGAAIELSYKPPTVSQRRTAADYPILGGVVDVQIRFPSTDGRLAGIVQRLWKNQGHVYLPHRLSLKADNHAPGPIPRLRFRAIGEPTTFSTAGDRSADWRFWNGKAAYLAPAHLARELFNRYQLTSRKDGDV